MIASICALLIFGFLCQFSSSQKCGGAKCDADNECCSGFVCVKNICAQPQPKPNFGLGLLSSFVGTWQGSGFNLISLPDFDSRPPSTGPQNYRVLLSKTKETLTFSNIGGPVANRGSLHRRNGSRGQKDINLCGLTYLQQISDAISGSPLHIEPGIWIHVPPSKIPPQNETYVRLATVPHGDSVLAQSTFSIFAQGGPKISAISSLPIGNDADSEDFLEPFDKVELPPGITQQLVLNPNLILQNAISKQKIINTVVIVISTSPVGGIVNIPFVQANANATQMNAIFWLETVQNKNGSTFLQLQYTQTVLLNYLGLSFPHITVSTLVKP